MGTQPNQKHFDLFVEIAKSVLGFTEEEERNAKDYTETVRQLRVVLFKVIGEIKQLTDSAPKELETMLMAAHYTHMRNVAITENLGDLGTKITVALLKYCGAVPADKLFYLAGQMCKENERYTSLAFVLLNRYIDLTEAIEDGDTSMLDNADLADTCIPSPFDYDLPKKQFQGDDKREEVRDWVLAMSMDQQVEQSLPAKGEGDPIYEALYDHNNAICIVTGHPVPNSLYMDMQDGAIQANKQDWNKYVSATKQDPWTGQPATPNY